MFPLLSSFPLTASLLRSMSKLSSTEATPNSEEYMAAVEKYLHSWNIPIEQIYKVGFFNFSTKQSVETVKQRVLLSAEHQTLRLLPKSSLERHKLKYKSLHIGMIQIAVKPLTKLGLKTCILLCLRDCRHENFENSLLGIIETSLCQGPMYFNCFPNSWVSLMDPRVADSLILNFKTNGYGMLPGSLPIALEFRVYYKVLTSNVRSPGGETVLIQANFQRSNVVFPDTIRWSEVQSPDQCQPPAEIFSQNPKVRRMTEIAEDQDGGVRLRFSSFRWSTVGIRE